MTSTQFLELLVSISVQAALLVVVTHWLTLWVASEKAHCRLWTLCYMALFLLAVAGVMLPHPKLFHPWKAVSPQTAATLAVVQHQAGRIVLAVWIVGVLFAALLFVVRLTRVHRFLKSCRLIEEGHPASEQLAVCQTGAANAPVKNAAGASNIRLLTSAKLVSPFCWQLHRPQIVLPEFLLESEGPEIRFILQHEMEHLRTGHPLQLFLQRVIEILFWFHPMIWWASQQSARAREFACDAAAVQSRSEIAGYLRSLLTIVERVGADRGEATTTLTFGRGGSLIADRARRLVRLAQDNSAKSPRRIQAAGAFASLVAAAAFAALLWLPVDVLSSSHAAWTAWPAWSSSVLHDFGVSAPDFEVYDRRAKLPELLELSGEKQSP